MDTTFRPRSNYAWAISSLFLIALFIINSLFVSDDPGQSLYEIALGAILGLATYLVWLRPKLVVKSDSVVVVNPLRTETIAFKDIVDLDTKWALTIVHSKGKTTAWVAPAGGKRRWIASQTFRWYGSGVPLSESNSTGETGPMSASLDSYSGQAAYLIREQMKRSH